MNKRYIPVKYHVLSSFICIHCQLSWLICAISYYLVFGAKRRHAKTRQMVTFSCFHMATLRPATRKYDTFHALPFRLLFVVSLSGGAKGRHAKIRQNHHLACFRVATFRPARRKREKAPRDNPQNGEKSLFGGFSRGDF